MVSKKNKRQFTFIAIVFILALLQPLFFKGSYIMDFLVMSAIWVIFATSLRLLTTLGLVSFAHNGFFAIGAYTSALLTMKLGLSFWQALVLSGVTPGIVALIIGYPLLRMKGHYFFLGSFALGMVIVLMFSTQWRRVLGGPSGISNIPSPSAAFASPIPYYYLALGLVVVVIALVYRLDHCRIGMEWHAIRDVDDLAALLGIGIVGAKMIAFIVACFFAGIAGSIYAHYVKYICPDSFGFPMMLSCLTSVIVGGMYNTWGPAIGVLLLRGITFGLGGMRHWEVLIYSAVLIVSIMLLPEGIVSLPKRIRGRRVKNGTSKIVETS